MGEVRTCVLLLFFLMQLQIIKSDSYLDSLICDIFCDDDSDYGICKGCSSSSEEDTPTKSGDDSPVKPSQNISIRIPASQGTILDILNLDGIWSVKVDAQGSGGSPDAGSSSAPSSTTAAPASSTTGAATTAAAKRK